MTGDEDVLRVAGLTMGHLALLAKWFDRGVGYRTHAIPKRHGGLRTIFEPNSEFDSILKQMRRALEASGRYQAPDCVHGYVKGRGIVTNASEHLAQPVVLCVDLKDFFPSISAARVARGLEAIGFDTDFAEAISRATTVQDELPSGFSTSPHLSNVVFLATDLKLAELATQLDLAYTRFADDLTFSGDFGDEVLDAVRMTLSTEGWDLSERKTRFMRRGGPQYVTGLYVGAADRPHVPRRIKRRLRQQFYYMAQYGFASAMDRGEVLYKRQAYGWVRYVGQAEPRAAARLQSILDQVDFSEEYLFWADSDGWYAILDEVGM